MKMFNPQRLAVWVSLLAIIHVNSAIAEALPGSAQNAPLSISNLVLNNLTGHPDHLAAKADVDAAKAALQASNQAVYNPELEFEYEDTEIRTKTIGIRQTIDWGDQKGNRTAVAQAGLQKVMADYELAMQSLISNLLTHLAQNQTNVELAKLGNESLRLMQEFSQIAERRYRAGDLSQVELNLARLSYSQALMQQANTLSDATEAHENLKAIFGTLPNTLPHLPEQMPEPVLNDNLEVLLKQLPIIRSQMAEIQVARQQVNLRKSEKVWNPTIGITAGSEGDESLVGINFSIPLNLRNNFTAEVSAAQQTLIASEQRAQQAYRDARASLIVTTDRYRNLLNAWNNWKQYSRSSVEQHLILIKKLWQAGDISAADYLLQLKQALETQATGLELRNQLWQVAFEWMSQTASIDQWLNINLELLEKN